MSKCYIRLDEDKVIIHAFSIKFESPEKDDILIEDTSGRHFNWNLLPKGLIDSDGKYNYKYVSKKIIERTYNEKWSQEELDAKEKQDLINSKKYKILEEQAIQRLKDNGKLDSDGNLIK